MLKKNASFLLVTVFLCALIVTAYASDANYKKTNNQSGVGTRMTYIRYFSYNISISSSGLTTSTANIDAYFGVEKVKISMYLQRSDGGWSTVKHWVSDYNGTHGSMSKNWYVARGYEYRILVYFYAIKGRIANQSAGWTLNGILKKKIVQRFGKFYCLLYKGT